MNQTYKKWSHYGELDLSSDDEININEDSNLQNDDAPIFEMFHDIYYGVLNNSHAFDDTTELGHEEPKTKVKRFYKLLKMQKIKRLYPNCEKNIQTVFYSACFSK